MLEREGVGFIEGVVSQPGQEAGYTAAKALVVVKVQASPIKRTVESFIRFRSPLLYRNDLAFGALLNQPVYRFGKEPLDHPD